MFHLYRKPCTKLQGSLDLSDMKDHKLVVPKEGRGPNNSPIPLKSRSLTVSPVIKEGLRKLSEDSPKKKHHGGITAFCHLLEQCFKSLDESKRIEKRELDMNILVVDDVTSNLKILASMLKRIGFTSIHTAENGLEAIMLCNQFPYDVIFMDGEMPGIDGPKAIQMIKKHSSLNANTFIIIQSTCKEMIDEMKEAAGEHSAVIDKPYKKGSTIEALIKMSKDLEKVIILDQPIKKAFKLGE